MTKIYSGKKVPTGLSVQQVERKRVARRPNHPFYIHQKPWQIVPFMIAPVIAGETMKNLNFQARAVSDQVKNPLMGAHLEHYFFYVPLRSISADSVWSGEVGDNVHPTVVEDMLLDISKPLLPANLFGIRAPAFYNGNTTAGQFGVNWVQSCYDKIVNHFFRDADETYAPIVPAPSGAGNYALAKLKQKGLDDSILDISEIPDVEVPTTGDELDLGDTDGLYQTWSIMFSQGFTQMSFEDYLNSFGVTTGKGRDPLVPELIRYTSEWSYPTNTVNPQDVLDGEGNIVVPAGTPTSAFSWSVADRADKDRFFREPGFIIGVTVMRPKVYLGTQIMAGSHLLDNALSWMPAIYKDNVELSLRKLAASTGPYGATRDADYWLDLRDLHIYGDQFVNVQMTTSPTFRDPAIVTAPHADGGQIGNLAKYANAADIDRLFVDSTKNVIRQDGMVSLNILGTQIDHT